MSKHLIWHADEILNYGVGNFESRLLLDSKMAGEPCINVNHVTVKPGIGTAHYITNLSDTDPLCFLTLWPNEEDNEVWHERKAAWGEGYETRRMPK